MSQGREPSQPLPQAADRGGRRREDRRRAIRAALRLRPATLVTLGAAVVAVTLAWADPFRQPANEAMIVSNQTGARRLFPTLVDADPAKATIELQGPDRPQVRLVPGPEGGHQVIRDEVLLGPVDADDFELMWSSLRMATILRKLERGDLESSARQIGRRGVVRVSLPGESFTLLLGETVVNGGVYAQLDGEAAPWVVDQSLAWLVEQPAQSWLAERLLDIDADRVTGLAWGVAGPDGGDSLVLARGEDGFWRVRAGAQPALLANEAVDFRLKRLLRAPLDPFFERDVAPAESLRPWLTVTVGDGQTRTVLVGGACPGHPDRRLVDRGPGLFGCLPAAELELWPLHDPDAGMLEPRLVPHDYGRIVQIDLEVPAGRSLIRRGGAWSLSEGSQLTAVSEDEVRRWYAALGRVEVAPLLTSDGGDTGDTGAEPDGKGPDGKGPDGDPDGDGEDTFVSELTLVIHADTNETLRVRCRPSDEPVVCVRDDGPRLRVLGELPGNLAFGAETFADRSLAAFAPGEARELEILPLGEGSATVRQSAHLDMGVWQLDSPLHVDGSGAIDEVRLENLLWTLSRLRADDWVEAPIDPPLRRLVVEILPERGARRTLSVDLYPGCVVEIEGHRPASIPSASCETLTDDLLFDDPLRFWLERSRSVEIRPAGADAAPVFLRREREQFVGNGGLPIDEDDAIGRALLEWRDWRSAGLRAGEPPGPARWSLDLRRDLGPRVQIELGEGWARLAGADWYYARREGAPIEDVEGDTLPEDQAPSEEFDPGAIELD